MKFGLLLIMLAFASDENEATSKKSEEKKITTEDLVLVKIEEEYANVPKKTSSIYFGVTFNKRDNLWRAKRWNKDEKKNVNNGAYKNEETAAHASDTLERQLMENGKQNHKLNFPNDVTEVHAEKKNTSSIYIGVFCNKHDRWRAGRQSKRENKMVYNGTYKDEETAAHASDTLARKLTANGKENHEFNFPNDITEVYAEKKDPSSIYVGVSYNKRRKTWCAEQWSKYENKMVYNGNYKDEITAAHARDTLARKLMENGEENHTFNFPNDITEVHHKIHKRKRAEHKYLEYSQNK